MKSADKFFKQIAYIFVAYTILLACVYPLFVESSFSWFFVASLTVILSLSLFIQYFFSVTYKLLLQADQKMYIVQLLQTVITILNLGAVLLAIKVFPELRFVKFCSVLLFVLQPIVYRNYVKKHYAIEKDVEPDENALSQRWACFGQNLAYFIHSNTDVVVLTVFSNLKTVSVYSVYFLVVSHLQSFFKSFSHAFSPMLGKAISIQDSKNANHYLDLYEFTVMNVATIIFGCCIYLLPSFALLYTHGITDVNYFRPVFSTVIILAEFVYCVRDPYVSVVYAAGRFKETANSAYIEAAINIVLSVILVPRYGLEGVAVGTFIGMFYRMVYLVWYIYKHVLYRPVWKTVKRLLIAAGSMVISCACIQLFDTTGSATFLLWFKNGVISVMTLVVVTVILNLLFEKELTCTMVKHIKKKVRG